MADLYQTLNPIPNSGGGQFFNGTQYGSSVTQTQNTAPVPNTGNYWAPAAPLPAPTPAPTPTQSGGGSITEQDALRLGLDWNNLPSGYSRSEPQVDYAAQARGEINAGYDAYFSQLDQMMNSSLPANRDAQLGIANSQGAQAENTLGGQYTQGKADLAGNKATLETNQAKTLQNLAEDIRNQFKAGQIHLGARGAGDSSAANQYAYAIGKIGNQARGKVMEQTAQLRGQIEGKEFALKNTYDTEIRNIKEQVNQKVMGVAQWFAEAQQQLQLAKANGQIQKGESLANLSKQLLQNATNQMLAMQQEASNRRLQLEQWAQNNSTTIAGLKSNLAQLSQGANTNVSQPGISSPIRTDAGGNLSQAWSSNLYGSDDNKWPYNS